MKIGFSNIGRGANILFILFVFIALLPCTVKGFALDFVEITYEKPIHPSKTTFEQQNCLSTVTQVGISIEITNNINFQTPVLNIKNESANNTQVFLPTTRKREHLHSTNQLPKYILFKRLRLALV